ncbi:glycosyltransferase [Flavihumibacter petaseus]|uniref:Putative glycosyltransferase n=1 Tax=Flavihumibacter petaseus NBRC 106054 TaxID=1220578 RepID=A0A0E9N2Z8_9BACT|nr:glycosyltransferase [Flavihumibacter petaseus]GAO44036.1 putative glycosyltransferase [Flavihumibacter petaseus NBRC 106054]
MFPDLLCFCHLRWNFVYQRPQHLLSRFARNGRVFVVEEPLFDAAPGDSHYETSKDVTTDLWIVELHIEPLLSRVDIIETQRILVDKLIRNFNINNFIGWYYTPAALEFSDHLEPVLTVYDCMDELSAFLNAPESLKALELLLLEKADIVFTGGQSLYEAKKHLHANIHPFPSSIDKAHFGKARADQQDPEDQAAISHPRIGFYGVIDERLHIALMDELALRKPYWHFILLGPVVKIDPSTLPRHANLHYPGGKSYGELPRYLAGWDIAMLPFALNESTRFISPTKTPEYLAGGKPVISTSVKDVVSVYGTNGLVSIADTADDFIAAAEAILKATPAERSAWLKKTDAFLAGMSWDKTLQEMKTLVQSTLNNKFINLKEKREAYV